ncbi:MAG: hypothetical protein AAF928_10040 [Myxococcota bacterium]
MPRETEVPTLRNFKVPVVLVVGGDDRLIRVVSEAALELQVLVVDCSPENAVNTAVQMQPLVMVVPSRVYDPDRPNFDALARDIRAELLRAGEEMPAPALAASLSTMMQDAEAKRPSWAPPPPLS